MNYEESMEQLGELNQTCFYFSGYFSPEGLPFSFSFSISGSASLAASSGLSLSFGGAFLLNGRLMSIEMP
jgi:hypothetical protein